ncbi:HNH endonuclease [Curtobacterium sp. MCSS17_008]|uniref:HNH endonuclease family protein n=1 Tax=Curtobacterium sp. MCSS17_008 TaxID=2175647 RepID=UPI000DA8E2CA|nr:HNH endonuclease family protein [Curtobacterium sp. MCSS17_008]PZF56511.1 HNH endonuclease [Curtobacterium sp. MCSS17_008]
MPSRRRRPRSTRTRSSRRSSRSTLTSLGVVVAVAIAGYVLHATGVLPTDAEGAPQATGGPDTSARAATARQQLEALPVKGKAPATGYDREGRFGTAWLDVDHNGCDTRNDVLARDLTDTERQGPCKVLRGTLVSPYTGERVDFVRGNRTSTLVQIDHVVALENAWRTGAQQLSQTEREALANDPTNLFAVDGHSNAQKRSGDAATWLPAHTAFRCTYVEHQIAVKTTYRLWVAPAEHDAMARVLDRC